MELPLPQDILRLARVKLASLLPGDPRRCPNANHDLENVENFSKLKNRSHPAPAPYYETQKKDHENLGENEVKIKTGPAQRRHQEPGEESC